MEAVREGGDRSKFTIAFPAGLESLLITVFVCITLLRLLDRASPLPGLLSLKKDSCRELGMTLRRPTRGQRQSRVIECVVFKLHSLGISPGSTTLFTTHHSLEDLRLLHAIQHSSHPWKSVHCSAGRRTTHDFTNLTHHGSKLFATPHTRPFRLQTRESSPKCLVHHHQHAKVVRHRQSRQGWRWRSRARSEMQSIYIKMPLEGLNPN